MDKELGKIIEPILKDYLKSTETGKNNKNVFYFDGKLHIEQESDGQYLSLLTDKSPADLLDILDIDFNESYDEFKDVCEKLELEKLSNIYIDKSACSKYKTGEKIPEFGTLLIIAAAKSLRGTDNRKDKLSVDKLLNICDRNFKKEKIVNQVIGKIYDCLGHSGELKPESLAETFKKVMDELKEKNKLILEDIDYTKEPISFLIALHSDIKETV